MRVSCIAIRQKVPIKMTVGTDKIADRPLDSVSDDDSGGLSINGSDLMVRALENEGVRYIFGVPGEENLDLV